MKKQENEQKLEVVRTLTNMYLKDLNYIYNFNTKFVDTLIKTDNSNNQHYLNLYLAKILGTIGQKLYEK